MTMFLDVLGLLALAHVLTRDLAARIAHELGCRTSRDGNGCVSATTSACASATATRGSTR